MISVGIKDLKSILLFVTSVLMGQNTCKYFIILYHCIFVLVASHFMGN